MDGEEKFCDKQTCIQEIMLDHEDKKGKLQKDPMVETTDTSSTLQLHFPRAQADHTQMDGIMEEGNRLALCCGLKTWLQIPRHFFPLRIGVYGPSP